MMLAIVYNMCGQPTTQTRQALIRRHQEVSTLRALGFGRPRGFTCLLEWWQGRPPTYAPLLSTSRLPIGQIKHSPSLQGTALFKKKNRLLGAAENNFKKRRV